jgi:hypothetical protein
LEKMVGESGAMKWKQRESREGWSWRWKEFDIRQILWKYILVAYF